MKAVNEAFAEASARFRQGILEAIGDFPDNTYPPRVLVIPDIPPTTLQSTADTS